MHCIIIIVPYIISVTMHGDSVSAIKDFLIRLIIKATVSN